MSNTPTVIERLMTIRDDVRETRRMLATLLPPQPTVAALLAAAEHYQRARDWDGDLADGEAALHDAGHALQDLCRRIGSEGIA